jgi:hypothetical protein
VLLSLKVALCAVFGIVLFVNVRTSPGDLAVVHARESSLTGMFGCKGCHGSGGKEAMAVACSNCHADIRAQIDGHSGLHGGLTADVASDCARCHAEHKGHDFIAVNRRSFALASIQDPSKFDHAGLAFRLTGKHIGAECAKCHRHADAPVLEKGQKRFLGLGQECTRCHEDVHRGQFGANCAACHGEELPFKSVAGFDHSAVYPLTGAHAGPKCSACHAEGTPHAIPASLEKRGMPVRSCTACHRSPHRDAFVASVADCATCHTAEHRTFLGPAATVTAEQHAATGFALAAPHGKVGCEKCHEGFGRRASIAKADDLAVAFRRLYPGRAPDDCAACHADPHGGQFRAQACLSCHARVAFTPNTFDVAAHDRTAFRLEGRHRRTDCAKCHKRPEPLVESAIPEPRVYHGTASDCRSCHQDVHEGQFEKGLFRGQDCRACHAMDAFRPSTFTVAMHDKTSFALTGAHRATACAGCHAATEKSRCYSGTASDCRACHKDVHEGRFDAADLPATLDGRSDCARCHSTDAFLPLHPSAFDHALWARHPLRGAHAKLDCAKCHGRAAEPGPRGRTLGPAAGTRCVSCHADPHAGQFGGDAAVNCASCHREEGTFSAHVFDHQKQSRFKLDEHHAKLACTACHKPAPLPGGRTAIRYKPLGIECRDCHEPRGPK